MLKFFISSISKALGFSKVEARGTLALILIMSATIAASQLYIKKLKIKPETTTNNDLSNWLAEVESSYDVKVESPQYDKTIFYPIESKPKKVAFSTKENSKKEAIVKKEIVVLDLNTATSDELMKVKGIGPAFSKRIVKYRDKLGGFASETQLSEVYGLNEETIQELSNYFAVQSKPKLIDLNIDTAKYLASHPYISYDLAWVIINYRKQNGDIHTLEDLKKIKAIDTETLEKLQPYLD